MSICCFTSFTFSYLAKARVLARSLKRHHPDWQFVALITDHPPRGFEFDPAQEPFDEIIWSDELIGGAWDRWIFKHDVIEACTAVKGPALDALISAGFEKVFYLDPDTAVLGSLDPLVQLLDEHSILLTPHQLEPDERPSSIVDNEVGSLKYGVYNLGFVAIRANDEGKRFARWWSDRLMQFCYDDIPNGLFVDQRWCDLAPCFFSGLHIVRDPGCNVASWNLNRRTLSIDRSGALKCNGVPLRFFHFTKLGPIGDTMTERYARDNIEVYELWSWYRRQVDRNVAEGVAARWWHYGAFQDATPIPKEARVLYRTRSDLQAAFPMPFAADDDSYLSWLRREGTLMS